MRGVTRSSDIPAPPGLRAGSLARLAKREPPSPPAKKAAAGQDQARKTSTDDWAGHGGSGGGQLTSNFTRWERQANRFYVFVSLVLLPPVFLFWWVVLLRGI